MAVGSVVKQYWQYGALVLLCALYLALTIRSLDGDVFKGNTDSVSYHQNALGVAQRSPNAIDDYFSPGYSILLGTWAQIVGTNVIALKVLSVLCGLGIVLLVYGLGALLVNKPVGVIAAGILSIDPDLRFFSANIFKETPFLFFFVLFIFLIVFATLRARTTLHRCLLYAAAGVALGFGVFFNAWLYAALLLLAYPLVIALTERKKFVWRSFGLDVVACVVGLIGMLVLINVLFFIPLHGSFVTAPTNGGAVLYYGNNPSAESSVVFTSVYTDATSAPFKEWMVAHGHSPDGLSNKVQAHYFTQYVVSYWLSHPGFLVRRVAEAFFEYWLFPTDIWSQRVFFHWPALRFYYWTLWVAAAIGLVAIAFHPWRYWVRLSALFFPMFLVAAVVCLTIYLMRYKLYLLPFEAILAAVGVVSVSYICTRWWREWRT
jgi:hypothetical protein